jgi:DNA-binding GntR family transcriptional regulator
MNNSTFDSLSDISHHESLTEKVRKIIEAAIINNELKPGEHLKELDLVDRLKISRGPVREAFRSLENAGLIVSQPRRGFQVAPLNIKEAMDLYEVRPWLEGQATRLAVKHRDEKFIAELQDIVNAMEKAVHEGDVGAYIRLDARFHRTIYENSNNDVLIDTMNGLWKKCLRYIIVNDSYRGEIKSSFERHRELFRSIRDDMPVKAQKTAERNLEKAKLTLLAGLQEAGIR